jgi:hypothetical protein
VSGDRRLVVFDGAQAQASAGDEEQNGGGGSVLLIAAWKTITIGRPNLSCSRGRAKSRQPGSSAVDVVMNWPMSIGTNAARTVQLGTTSPSTAPGSTNVVAMMLPGTSSTMATYHFQATRHRTSRRAHCRSPARPSMSAVTMNAAPSGPM